MPQSHALQAGRLGALISQAYFPDRALGSEWLHRYRKGRGFSSGPFCCPQEGGRHAYCITQLSAGAAHEEEAGNFFHFSQRPADPAFFHLIISAGAADKEGTTNLQGADGMHTTDRIRVSKGQVMMRLGAVVFVTTGLFLGALLAALAGV